jgi:hypothetical protein
MKRTIKTLIAGAILLSAAYAGAQTPSAAQCEAAQKVALDMPRKMSADVPDSFDASIPGRLGFAYYMTPDAAQEKALLEALWDLRKSMAFHLEQGSMHSMLRPLAAVQAVCDGKTYIEFYDEKGAFLDSSAAPMLGWEQLAGADYGMAIFRAESRAATMLK